jgi:hypothetical protein
VCQCTASPPAKALPFRAPPLFRRIGRMKWEVQGHKGARSRRDRIAEKAIQQAAKSLTQMLSCKNRWVTLRVFWKKVLKIRDIPLLVRRVAAPQEKKVPFRKGADGVVAHTPSFKTHSEMGLMSDHPSAALRWLRDLRLNVRSPHQKLTFKPNWICREAYAVKTFPNCALSKVRSGM